MALLRKREGHRTPLTTLLDNGGYETHRAPYLLALPLMWLLVAWVAFKKAVLKRFGRRPAINTFWFDGLSEHCRRIKEGAATWRALDIIYNYPFGTNGRVSDFWIGMRNAQAVRNRKKLVTTLLVYHAAQTASPVPRLLSLASGSAQSIIEALVSLRAQGLNAEAVLVDVDETALQHSQELAERYGVAIQIKLVLLDVRDLLRLERSLRPYGLFHVAEVVGWLEYDKDKRIKNLFRAVRTLLAPDGVLVTSTINPNPERWFLEWVIDWKMIYRDAQALRSLLGEAGFAPERCEVSTEPQGIFHVAVSSTSL